MSHYFYSRDILGSQSSCWREYSGSPWAGHTTRFVSPSEPSEPAFEPNYECKVCGHRWFSAKRPIVCADCGCKFWRKGFD